MHLFDNIPTFMTKEDVTMSTKVCNSTGLDTSIIGWLDEYFGRQVRD